MATATTAPEGAEYDIKTVVVKVRNAATTKLEFLRALANKIANAISDGIAQTLSFARRLWTAVPNSVTGALASGLTSTRAGYTFVTSTVKKSLKFVTNVFFKGLIFTNNAIDIVGGQIAHIVRKIHEPSGVYLRNLNANFTDLRMNAMDWAYRNLVGMGTMLKAAYTTDTTVRTVTIGSTAITAGIVGNLAFNGTVSAYAATVPFAGGAIVAALSGGIATIIAIAGIASVGATLSLLFKRNEVIANVIESVEEKVMQAAALYEETQLQSEIISILSSEAEVVVQGDVTPEQAQKVAEEHVKQEVAVLERSLKRDYPKARQGQHSKPKNKSAKKR